MFSGKSLDFVVKTVVNTCRRVNNVLMFLFVHFACTLDIGLLFVTKRVQLTLANSCKYLLKSSPFIKCRILQLEVNTIFTLPYSCQSKYTCSNWYLKVLT